MCPILRKAQKFVCHCLRVTHAQIVEAIDKKKIQNIKDVISYTQAGDGCTACHPVLKRYLKRKGYLSGEPICSAK